MTRKRTILRLFLASPIDCSEERILAERVIGEVNSTVARKLGYGIELVQWEDVVPGMGRPEQVILDQVDLEDTDLFVGLLWNRFGTPTGKAQSGTEEEFQIAYATWRQHGKPRILFYFCQRAANLRTLAEIEQKSRVVTFRSNINALGLMREYDALEQFEASLRQDLTNHILDIGFVPRPTALSAVPFSKPADGQVEDPRLPSDEHAEIDGMVFVPPGEFLAGRARTLTVIPYGFYVDQIPVTNHEYLTFLQETGFMTREQDAMTTGIVERFRGAARARPDHPVTGIGWHDAVAYATWKRKRLPTALEWERAARGVDGRNFPWGDQFDPTLCNSLETNRQGTTPVRAHPGGRSPCGCYDMAGNVFEWVLDWASQSRHTRRPNTEKTNCGGSYNREAADLMCWYQESDPPWMPMADVGFRCVWTQNATEWSRNPDKRSDQDGSELK